VPLVSGPRAYRPGRRRRAGGLLGIWLSYPAATGKHSAKAGHRHDCGPVCRGHPQGSTQSTPISTAVSIADRLGPNGPAKRDLGPQRPPTPRDKIRNSPRTAEVKI
jgi:hypothetical protein